MPTIDDNLLIDILDHINQIVLSFEGMSYCKTDISQWIGSLEKLYLAIEKHIKEEE